MPLAMLPSKSPQHCQGQMIQANVERGLAVVNKEYWAKSFALRASCCKLFGYNVVNKFTTPTSKKLFSPQHC